MWYKVRVYERRKNSAFKYGIFPDNKFVKLRRASACSLNVSFTTHQKEYLVEELFKLRWRDRASALQQEFLNVRQEMNSRGMLNSSTTIQKAYDVIVEELEVNRLMISQTIVDHIKQSKKIANAKNFERYALDQLSERKLFLEKSLESAFANVISGLNNKTMIAPFRSLNSKYELATSELKIELNSAISEYNKSFGNSLTAQLKTQFLNYPILAVCILSVTGATFIIGLLKLLGVVSFE